MALAGVVEHAPARRRERVAAVEVLGQSGVELVARCRAVRRHRKRDVVGRVVAADDDRVGDDLVTGQLRRVGHVVGRVRRQRNAVLAGDRIREDGPPGLPATSIRAYRGAPVTATSVTVPLSVTDGDGVSATFTVVVLLLVIGRCSPYAWRSRTRSSRRCTCRPAVRASNRRSRRSSCYRTTCPPWRRRPGRCCSRSLPCPRACRAARLRSS